jgi:hypothetical protein
MLLAALSIVDLPIIKHHSISQQFKTLSQKHFPQMGKHYKISNENNYNVSIGRE